MARSFLRMAGWTVALLTAVGSTVYAAHGTMTLPSPFAGADVGKVAQRAAQPVRVTRVAYTSTGHSNSYTGTIRPKRESPMGFRLPGKLVARLVDVGDRVKAGQIVARLDDTDARLELEAAAAEQASAHADLLRAKAAEARSRDLFAQGHVAQSALDGATSAAAAAVSRAEQADRMKALAANRLAYMSLAAETDGVVTATEAETGQVLAAGQPVLTLANADGLDVVFALPEQQRALLRSSTATAELWGDAGQRYALTLRDISPDVDPVGRTYRVRMNVAAPDAAAALGRTVTVGLATSGTQASAKLPLAAVLNDGTGAAVWRLPPGADMVERVPVDLAEIEGDEALVQGGLAEGDIVISLGANKIDPARPVRVVEAPAAPESR